MISKYKISVIIPAYNCEKTIEKCIKSILLQTFQNLEILIINDGSKDNTRKIVENLQQKDNRIKLINQKNSGVSASRNKGLINATGDYLTFVDADDFLEPNMYEELITIQTTTDADISMCAYNLCEGKNRKKIYFPWEEKCMCFQQADIINNLLPKYIAKLKEEKNSIYGSVWRLLIKKSVVNKITFNSKIKIGEDLLFIIDLFSNCNKVIAINMCLYNYVVYKNSAIGKYKEDLNITNALFHSNLEKKLKDLGFLKRNKIRYQLNKNSMYTTAISNEVKNKSNSFIEKREKIKKLVLEFNNDAYIDNEIVKQLSFFRKIIFYLMKCKAILILTVLFLLKEKYRQRK